MDKMKLQNKCEMNVKNLKANMTGNEDGGGLMLDDDLHVYLKFHVENGTLAPIEFAASGDDSLGKDNPLDDNQPKTDIFWHFLQVAHRAHIAHLEKVCIFSPIFCRRFHNSNK